jgi:hypothetical protein
LSEAASTPSLTIEPPPSGWAALSAGKRQLRIMTGHQAEIWHPGILAKYLAAGAPSIVPKGVTASVTWLFVDQDSNDPSKIAYPATNGNGPVKATWKIPYRDPSTASAGFADDTPTAALPPLAPPSANELTRTIKELKPALPCVAEGLVKIAASLEKHAHLPNAARQIAAAAADLLAPILKAGDFLFATEFNKTDLFAGLVEMMRADPEACVRAYNAAVAHAPHAHMRPLEVSPGRVELPLWRMPTAMGQARRRIFASDLASVPLAQLAPRALLMTAIARLDLCDLFIHGIGGSLYDRATEAWLGEWLPGRQLAPTAVVTATRLLPFEDPPLTPEGIARAVWRSHHDLHSPGALGDAAGAARKQELLQDIRTARSKGREPAGAFRELHVLLDRVRAERAGAVEQLRELEASARKSRAKAQVVYDRTWPFPLYPDSELMDLQGEINRAIAAKP